MLGSSGLHRRDWSIGKFEIGYWCRKRFQGQGYITEAVRGIMRFGFETLEARRLEIHVDLRNVRSLRVAERVGMRREAEHPNAMAGVDGSVQTLVRFAMTDEAWQESQRER
jgi:RimJ/RimL family protein N-acetyltransferase